MSKVFSSLGVSADGFLAGPRQTRKDPLGEGGEQLHRWMFETPDENRAEIDAIVDAGAFIMGRNMFGPVRGEWDEDWRGWWGDEPPYRGPVFVLTHFPHEPIEMEGGTTFHFVTDGIESALKQARAAAGDRNVSVAGGASTVNQYLAAGLIHELRLHIAPLVLGQGERLFAGLSDLNLEPVSSRTTSLVTHVTYRVGR
ncbi:dihydrofolate reductase family protein [Amycolatopsis methanolica]|uniref:Riboflavin biosynthesis protein RibD n=1 Tax=Amycolatopsis methanolica 239 TaxID=1068978 RepID=A0A076MLT4_AMYME|nr:dihydrofolate reductase family protein [Amycolatopsis methanolica]AIJ21758.1 riboflavin biosynthesis protein RibD [Amycolatopsis methanolica 239]